MRVKTEYVRAVTVTHRLHSLSCLRFFVKANFKKCHELPERRLSNAETVLAPHYTVFVKLPLGLIFTVRDWSYWVRPWAGASPLMWSIGGQHNVRDLAGTLHKELAEQNACQMVSLTSAHDLYWVNF